METVARDCVQRNVEERSYEHGAGHGRGFSLRGTTQPEGPAAGVFDPVGTAAERDDVHVDVLPQSKLWALEKVLRL